jgi:DNA-binding response OmpR family regulator
MKRAKPLIVVVEDEPTLRADLAEELILNGYDVIEAQDGREGFKAIEQYQPDLVVSDINMSVENGFDLLKRIRDLGPKYADVPFLFLSALSAPAQVVEGIRLGADDYITKPVDYELLLVKIESNFVRNERFLLKILQDRLGLSVGGGAVIVIIMMGVFFAFGMMALIGLYFAKFALGIDVFQNSHLLDFLGS